MKVAQNYRKQNTISNKRKRKNVPKRFPLVWEREYEEPHSRRLRAGGNDSSKEPKLIKKTLGTRGLPGKGKHKSEEIEQPGLYHGRKKKTKTRAPRRKVRRSGEK